MRADTTVRRRHIRDLISSSAVGSQAAIRDSLAEQGDILRRHSQGTVTQIAGALPVALTVVHIREDSEGQVRIGRGFGIS